MIGDTAFVAMLGFAGLLAVLTARKARPAARAYLQFAAVLYIALSVADEAAIFWPHARSAAAAVTLIIYALAPVALALALFAAFEHPPKSWIAAVVLVLACCAALAAAVSGAAALSFAPLTASVCAMLALSVRKWRAQKHVPVYAVLSALCVLCGAAAGASAEMGNITAPSLFCAAGILGMALALARSGKTVAEQGGRNPSLGAIGRLH